jgi:hypothetical protein
VSRDFWRRVLVVLAHDGPVYKVPDLVADGAWGTVWLHGKWRYLTSQMTTAEREHAADAVARWSAMLAAEDNDPDRSEPEGLRWWREDR